MKRPTVAAAALAAGMMTIVAKSHAESDRNLFHNPAAKVAATDRKMEKPKAERPVAAKDITAKDSAPKGAKRTASLAKRTTAKASKAKARKAKAARVTVDLQETASIARMRPALEATARKSVEGLDSGTTSESPASAVGYTTLVSHYAAAYGVPVSLAHAVISVESNYRPNMLGSAGEIGLMQIKPATARMMGYTGSAGGLFNPETNIKYGMKYLGVAHQLSGGTTCGTILRYNAGHAARHMNPVSATYCSKVQRRLGGTVFFERG
jgi:soluble lytic murein transglycosylase-like protein